MRREFDSLANPMIAINNSTMYTMTCKVSLLDLVLLGGHREPFNRVLVEYGPRWNHDLGVCQSGPALGRQMHTRASIVTMAP